MPLKSEMEFKKSIFLFKEPEICSLFLIKYVSIEKAHFPAAFLYPIKWTNKKR